MGTPRHNQVVLALAHRRILALARRRVLALAHRRVLALARRRVLALAHRRVLTLHPLPRDDALYDPQPAPQLAAAASHTT